MKLRQIAAGLCIALAASAGAKELSVAPGQTLTIGPAQASLQLDRLVLGDNAVVRFAPGVDQWRVDARQAVIGRDVLIDGAGSPGAPGAAGAAAGPAESCRDGAKGGSGGAGEAGADGVSMQLRLGVQSLEGLRIVSSGGAGGAGGPGGAGQAGGARSGKCPTPDGGDGGNGGMGGAGGSGGAVQISYYGVAGQDGFYLRDRISVTADGGAGGRGGAAGKGGAAQPGAAARTTNPIGTNVRVAGGEPGQAGVQGEAGEAGRDGTVAVQEIAALPGAALPATRETGGSEVEQLRREMEQLTREFERVKARMQELEQQR